MDGFRRRRDFVHAAQGTDGKRPTGFVPGTMGLPFLMHQPSIGSGPDMARCTNTMLLCLGQTC